MYVVFISRTGPIAKLLPPQIRETLFLYNWRVAFLVGGNY